MGLSSPRIALVDAFPDYEVDTEGRVFSRHKVQHFKGRWGWQTRNKAGKQIADYNSDGYRQVSLYRDGKKHRVSVHRLVAKAFIPNPDNLPEVNHIDEIRSNNKVTNLEWATRTSNALHSVYKTTGSLCGTALLDEASVFDIKQLFKEGYDNKTIASWYEVSHSAISKIRTGKNWSHV